MKKERNEADSWRRGKARELDGSTLNSCVLYSTPFITLYERADLYQS